MLSTEQVRKALGLWHKSAVHGSPLLDLLLVQQAAAAAGGNLRLATNQVLHRALTIMAAHHADEADLLRVRYLDAKTVHLLSLERNLAQATIYFQQQRAISLLTTIVQQMEQAAWDAHRTALESRLPLPTYTSLVGVEAQLNALLGLLASPDSSNLILLDGIGGIGKTSLADALLRTIIARGMFAEVAWISAQQQHFHLDGRLRNIPRSVLTADGFVDELADLLLVDQAAGLGREQKLANLRVRMSQTAHLVVLDNLELMPDVDRLLPFLHQLAGPSRFLLISRHSFYAEPGIYHLRLPELVEADALHLVRQEAGLRNLPELATAPDAHLQPIYETVGGNPLALRLVVGQVHVHPLPVILADLAAARGESVEALYTYIYRRAWDHLDELCRRALLAMPLVSEHGGNLDFLAQISQLPSDDLRHGLSLLVTLNLVDSRGDLQQRRYTIHNLTRSFLLEQVVRWQV
ncbi:MAG: ATP-binding protein [Anaerolineae bacterium]